MKNIIKCTGCEHEAPAPEWHWYISFEYAIQSLVVIGDCPGCRNPNFRIEIKGDQVIAR
jgi:hypothetical protein